VPVLPVPMVGRTGELAEIVGVWTRLAKAPCTVVVTGGAGTGKSRLIAAVLETLAPRPAVILPGAARLHTPSPYDWLASILNARDTQALSIPPDARAWLTQDKGVPVERYAPSALLRLAARVVRELTGPGPAVIVADDLHALDPASLNLLGEIAASPDLPALLLVTSRQPETELVARTLARLSGTPGAVRQHLGPLRQDDVAAILEQLYPAPLPVDLAASVWERTQGNPYWLSELLATVAGEPASALLTEPLPAHLHLTAPPGLTAREQEVLGCLVAGMSNKQMARSMGISIRTVAVHVSNLLRKTGLTSRTEAAVWAARTHGYNTSR
jgi:DNA-binding CsgD family transcriptional regulator/predicted ATPase